MVPRTSSAYIDALAVRYSADPKADRPAMARAFSQAMGNLSKKYPDDLDAAVIYAESLMNLTPWKLWTPDGAPAANTEEIVTVLEWCCCGIRITSARITTTFTPSRPPARRHARWPARCVSKGSPNPPVTCFTCRRTFMRVPATMQAPPPPTRRAPPPIAATSSTAPPNGMYGMMYYPHNLQFLADSHMMQGRFADAKQAAARVAEQLAPHVTMMPMVESMMVMPVSVLLRFAQVRRRSCAAPAAPRADGAACVASLRARDGNGKDRQGR